MSSTGAIWVRLRVFLQSGQAVATTSGWLAVRLHIACSAMRALSGRRQCQIGKAAAAAERVLALVGGGLQSGHAAQDIARWLVYACTAAKFARVVVGNGQIFLINLYLSTVNQAFNVFGVVQNLNAFEIVVLAENLVADWARRYKRAGSAVDNRLTVFGHQFLGGGSLSGKFHRSGRSTRLRRRP